MVSGTANYVYYCESFNPNLMLALDSFEGLEHTWAWFAEGPGEAGVVLGTSR